jgi:GMP synthase-like glutamine amidotransferase
MMDLRIAVIQHEPATGLGAFTELIAAAGVEADVVRAWQDPLPELEALDGVIVLGGSARATDPALAEERAWIAKVAAAGVPYLGVCLGAQLLAGGLGGRIVPARRPEIGIGQVFLTDAGRRDPLFDALPSPLTVFQWHGDTFDLPRGAVPLAGSLDYRYQAFRWGTVAYGVQFHPEVTARTVAAWPWVPAYLDQLQTAGIDAGLLLAELAREEPRLRELARRLLNSWLLVCARAGGYTPAARARALALSS